MVNRGRSGGCLTCKERRVKCDEARPKCRPCQRLGIPCAGYKTRYANIRFKDQSHKFYSRADGECIQKPDWLPVLRPLAQPDTAVPFYLRHYAGMGREMGSARGFFEVLIPIYASQRPSSALSLAVSALASEIMSLWRHESFQSSRETYTQAIRCLRSTIQDVNEWGKPETALAVLSLQLYESVAAIYGLRSATRIHHDGALSLLPFADPDYRNGITNAYIRRFIVHTEVCSAMRQKRLLQSGADAWIRGNGAMPAPDNPSCALDAIGASVANLQASYTQLETPVGSISSSQRDLGELIVEAKLLDEQLLAWARDVPDHWQPLQLSGQDIDPSIPTYRSVCEVYSCCQIAAIWNLWRIQRLLLIKIILGSIQMISHSRSSRLTEDVVSTNDETIVDLGHTFQELVDSLCHSVPFYMGNRTNPSNMADFTDPEILFPSDCYRHRDSNPHSINKLGSSGDEQKQSIIAQGPWHVMSPLSHILTLVSEDRSQLLATFLRYGQREWIREQFLRVTRLLRIPSKSVQEPYLRGLSAQRSADTGFEDLVKGVRKGAIFMSGP
ncbi:hypothetical protein N7492_004797 [Penicillium capsulatum]|uniref:Zn(2)-C6 fungal-type domain-containing protein n=1 Tax=Penicillium capsulatum TaxID=69766 RepID=A0A9W9IAJ0_9EURO|nr:hypothetical protein N7492_004797 [Penicillium capsulatum]KAJ6136094.1 hypothetical protein N7512_001254 [Penicillium capsulatum]